MRLRRPRNGFTLLELLVVISIIAILMAMGVVAFSTAQKRGRDTKRRADLQAIQKAQEQYYAANQSYLVFDTMNPCDGAIGEIMESIPTDPKNTSPYTYYCTGTASAYCLHVTLEDDTAGNCSSCVWNAGSYTFGAGTTRFCVKNLQ